ncbi:MAG TPA: IgGFc-binding protein [Polyangiaceae bacterium]|nr:IgGFc-binding protein [Polyangiaceae bacterium]
MASRPTLLAAALLFGVCFHAACGSSNKSSGFSDDGGLDGSTGDDGTASSSSGGSGGSSGGFFGDASGDGAGCGRSCSSDLHSVIDCNGNVVTTCPTDQGCGANAMCVPACQAATANKSTIGCDYYSVDPGTDGEANGSCFAAYIANTWGAPVGIQIEYGGMTVDASPYAYIPSGQGSSITYAPLSATGGMLPPNQLAIVFLADATAVTGVLLPTACPAGTTALYKTAEASSSATGIINAAFHIITSAPVVAYDIFPYGGSKSYISSASLLIPTSAWDTNYLAIDAYSMNGISNTLGQPFIEVTSAHDGTKVTILPTAAIAGGSGVPASPANTPVSFTLNHGQVLQLKQDAELNGSVIQSTQPVGVWGGHACVNIAPTDCCCDSAHQELPPVKALGNEYVAVKYRDRIAGQLEDPPWRIMGAVNGTTLTYLPAAPNGAPTTLSVGQVVQFNDGSPFVVTSQDAQHPFYVSGHMTGQCFGLGNSTCMPGSGYGTGDPEFVNIIPPAQWLTSYVFMTDPTMANTNLVLVRKQVAGAYADVKLDCLGTVSGWLPVGGGSPYELARVDLAIAGAGQAGCNNGRHEISSTAPFGLTVWGWDEAVSYAFPSGASVQPINTVVVPPMSQ